MKKTEEEIDVVEELEKRQKPKVFLFIAIVVLALSIFITIDRLRNVTETPTGPTEEWVRCIVDSGATMYGAEGCSWCAKQKQLFGNTWIIMEQNFVECNPNVDGNQAERCLEEEISGYPTWKFAGDDTTYGGYLTIPILSEKTGCSNE